MGNSLPLPCPCVCHHEAADGTAGAKRRKRRKQKRPAVVGRRSVRAARPGHVVPVVDTPPEDGDGGGEEVKEAWLPGCRVETDGGGVWRVKIVMKRKDIAELVARLERRDAAERDARMVELNAGVVTMSPCRDAWRPRLSIIPENY